MMSIYQALAAIKSFHTAEPDRSEEHLAALNAMRTSPLLAREVREHAARKARKIGRQLEREAIAKFREEVGANSYGGLRDSLACDPNPLHEPRRSPERVSDDEAGVGQDGEEG